MRDADDAILEACLDEVLGGAQPPDLSGRILAALALNSTAPVEASPSAPQSAAPARMAPIPVRPNPVCLSPASLERTTSGRANSMAGDSASRVGREGAAGLRWYRSHKTLWHAAAAVLLLSVGLYGYFRPGAPDANQVANSANQTKTPAQADQSGGKSNGAARTSPASDRVAARPAPGNSANGESASGESASYAASAPEGASSHPADDTQRRDREDAAPAVTDVAQSPAEDNAAVPASTDVADTASPTPDRVADASTVTHDDRPQPRPAYVATSAGGSAADVVAFIDESLRGQWREMGLKPSPPATDAEWCRRLYLDMVGRIPSTQELESFLLDRARDKRSRLVDQLLSEDYVETFARHWTTQWTNTLIGRSGGQQPDSLVNRAGLQQYLRRAFLHNKPYDQLVYELLSATGSNRPGDEDFNGAVNFLLDNLQEDAATATAKTGQVFLGVQIQCTQCHNHPFNEWKQNQFWELNAFFRQTRDRPERVGADLVAVRLTNEDFAGAQGDTPREAEIFYELRNGTMQVAWPRFVDGTVINPSGLIDEVNRRDELARLVVQSEYLGKAIVNRLWGHFFGYGFTKPVDDMGPHNSPSHPELLDRLAVEFVAHGHDLKELMRWIALSEAYGLSSKFGPQYGNGADDPTLGVPPQFSHFYLRQMTAEQLYDSLLVATEAEQSAGGYEEREAIKRQWLDQFTLAFGTDDNGEASTFDGTITQALMMMNGELTRQATSGQAGGFLQKVSARVDKEPAQISHLYLAALARKPSRQELQLANGLLASRRGDSATVLEDVWWALLNSNEFILNH